MKAKEEFVVQLLVNLVMYAIGVIVSFTISWKVGVLYIVTIGPILSEIRTVKRRLLK